jgi:hypothetical protein
MRKKEARNAQIILIALTTDYLENLTADGYKAIFYSNKLIPRIGGRWQCLRFVICPLSYVLISHLSVVCHAVTAVAITSTIFCDMTP